MDFISLVNLGDIPQIFECFTAGLLFGIAGSILIYMLGQAYRFVFQVFEEVN